MLIGRTGIGGPPRYLIAMTIRINSTTSASKPTRPHRQTSSKVPGDIHQPSICYRSKLQLLATKLHNGNLLVSSTSFPATHHFSCCGHRGLDRIGTTIPQRVPFCTRNRRHSFHPPRQHARARARARRTRKTHVQVTQRPPRPT